MRPPFEAGAEAMVVDVLIAALQQYKRSREDVLS